MNARKTSGNKTSPLFDELAALQTEQSNPESLHIDTATPLEIARLMNRGDESVARSVGKRVEAIAEGITLITTAFRNGGRLFYAGSGTSGRLGILDASECPPTFGTEASMVQGLIAGGPEAVFRAKEGAEDKPENGAEDIRNAGVNSHDVVCGLTASGRTPYVLGALEEAGKAGAVTILICCVDAGKRQPGPAPDLIIDVPVGPEIIAGSTRLKSGTAQKMVCNMLTTGAMIRLGKVYQNVMVDLQLTNQKLHERARRILMQLGKVEYEQACDLLRDSGNHVKTALIMALAGVSAAKAGQLLQDHDGFIRPALEQLESDRL